MFNKILVPIDGSSSSKLALKKAISFGNKYESKLFVLSVAPEAYVMKFTSSAAKEDGDLEEGVYLATRDIIFEAEEMLKNEYKYEYSCVYRVGDAANEIVDYAEKVEADIIILGHRGLNFVSRTLLGSVSNKVINRSPISVLVVKSDEDSLED